MPTMLRIAAALLLPISLAVGQSITSLAGPTVSTCKNSNCSVSAARGQSFGWEQRAVNTTIVAATVVTIVNKQLSTSRITTVFNKLPAGYSLPPTNAEGTLIQRITYTRLGQKLTTDLAFPSGFRDYIDIYTWNGTLASDSPTCLTAKLASTGSFTTFPPQPPLTFPTYKSGSTTITDDRKGLYFSLATSDIQLGDFSSFYTDVAPIKSCTLTVTSPVIPYFAAQFLTQSSISYEDGSLVATPILTPVPSPTQFDPPSAPSPQMSAEQTLSINMQPSLPPASGPSQLRSTLSAAPIPRLSSTLSDIALGVTSKQSSFDLLSSAASMSTPVATMAGSTRTTASVPTALSFVPNGGVLLAPTCTFTRALIPLALGFFFYT